MRQLGGRVLQGLGPLESKVMALLWRHGDATVRWVAEHLAGDRRPAYTTVMTVMTRLTEKGVLTRRPAGRAYVYSPAKTRAEYLNDTSRTKVRALVRDYGEVALAQFVQEIEGADPKRLARLSALLKERDSHEPASS